MCDLLSLQRDFQAFLLHPDDDRIPVVIGRDPADARARSHIYASAYRARLVEALGTNYPRLASWMGEGGFAELGLAYLAKRPSHYRSIRHFGDELGDFLARTQPWQRRPALAEMARFEWALAATFDAADAECADAGQMRALRPEGWAGTVFVAHPSVCLLDLDWNVVAIWKDLDQARPARRARRVGRRTWLIWRYQLESHFRSLAVDEASALRIVLDGRTFADVCEALCVHWPREDVASRAAALLRGWLDGGLISEIRAPAGALGP
jgi:hypothetical protein